MKDLVKYMSLCITVVLFTTQLISICVTAPIPRTNGPWVNPCGGESASGLSLNTPSSSSPPITEGLVSLERMSRAAMDQTDSLIMAISKGISSDLRKYLDFHPPLDGFPVTDESFTPGIQLDVMVRTEIDRLSKVGVFLEAARLDTSAYQDKIRTLEQQNVEMLCNLHTMLPGRSVTADVSRDIMPMISRNLIDTTQIDARNYLILRDVKKVFLAIEESLESYKEELVTFARTPL